MRTPTRIGSTVASGALEEGRKRISSAIKDAALDALSESIPLDIAKLLGAQSVRLYLRDPLTDELYARWTEDGKPRELRAPSDLSSPAGYAAMTRTTSYAWTEGRAGDRRYVVAIPFAGDADVLGVVELVHGKVGATLDDTRAKVLASLASHASKRLQLVLRASPHSGVASPDALREARAEAQACGRSVEFVLMARHGIDKASVGRGLADQFRCPFVAEPSKLRPSGELLARFTPGFLRANAVLPVRVNGGAVEVALANPRNLTLLDDIVRTAGAERVTASVGIREDILEALERALTPSVAPPADDSAFVPIEPADAPIGAAETFDFSKITHAGEDHATIRLVNEIIQTAIDRGASDVHIEPTRAGGVVVRLRVDGVLQENRAIREGVARAVASRVKIMSRLDIAEKRLPQDGKIRLRDRAGAKVDLRVAVVPTQDGYEDVVLRLLPDTQALPLDRLAMEPETAQRFRKAIEQPHGIVLCVGPTGSGKTTTLHAGLGHLKGPGVKIWTAEDPVEISQEGIRQVQVHSKIGLTFAHALRAFLRCDPDIIMIGEIRDRETAQAAIEASLTGHLVLSTLHTNSAAETVTRLLEMGLDAFTFGDSLRAVLAQRLVRRVCDSCRESHVATSQELDELRIHAGDGFKLAKAATMAHGSGCDACFKSGYRGRLGIHELLVVTPELRKLIQQRAEADRIRKAAVAAGMTLLKQDGVRKVAAGLTDLPEVIATCIDE